MIYTVLEEWADQVWGDRETSTIDGHIGTFLEEV